MTPRRRRLTGVVAQLTTVNVLNLALGFITGPILARTLGTTGRGDLAAIQVPLVLAPAVLGLGITAFAYRALPRGQPIEEVIGSLGLPLFLIGCVAAVASVPIADALAAGRATVRTFLIISFLAMPAIMVSTLLVVSLSALERWRAVAITAATPFVLPFVATLILWAAGRLTVASAAVATIAGTVLTGVPGLWLLVAGRRPRFRLSVARQAVSFGLKSWVGGLALLANARLDQFLMITAVAPRVLGLYVVATTLSGASSAAVGALMPPLMTRIASGETHLLPHAVRIAFMGAAGFNLLLGLATPAILTVLFGPSFEAALPMAIVLLVANVPQSGAFVLSGGLQADGAPLIPSVAEAIALVVTLGGLAALLGPLGGLGAAIVSLAAYGTSFVFQLFMAVRRTGFSVRAFLVPTRADARWARARVAAVAGRSRAVIFR